MWTIAVIVAVAALYVAAVLWDVKHDVHNAPRTDMFLCNKHGAVPIKYAVHLDMAGITEKPIPYCPFCFNEKMKKARGK